MGKSSWDTLYLNTLYTRETFNRKRDGRMWTGTEWVGEEVNNTHGRNSAVAAATAADEIKNEYDKRYYMSIRQ